MQWWEALVLGVVEGVTEYLPVSSTGHLVVTQRALGLPATEASNAYAVCIQAGAIVAVLGIYRARFQQMLRGVVGRSPAGLRFVRNVAVAFLPAAVFGLAFDDWIEERLFGVRPIVAAWFVGGIAILAVERWRRRRLTNEAGGPALGLDELGVGGALAIGLFQCAALWPGTSRSLATIVGGLVVGLEIAAAVEFTFLLGVVTLLAATAYKALDSGPAMIEAYSFGTMALGFVAAWVAAFLAVKWMLAWLTRHGLAVFGVYRIALAALVGAWYEFFPPR